MKGGRELGKRFAPGEAIFLQGEPARAMYVIQKGEVEIVMDSEYGPRHLNTLGEGEIFGEISLFSNRARIATARAVTEVRVLQLDEKTFLARLHQDPSLAYRLIRKLAQRIYEQDHELMRDHALTVECCPISGFSSYIDLAAFLESEVKRARRLKQTMAFVLLDIVEFEAVEERHGTAAGERILHDLALLLREHLRRTDVAGRFGRSRFGLLLYEADGNAAVQVIEKVRRNFGELRFPGNGEEYQCRLACGVAIFPEHNHTIALNQAAYKALMRAKADPACVILAEPGVT
ncbi:MAG: cyclic nucleotide-binding domain-containing protein [Magnetococcales bacterium]|nr:cyclic nucleotide-binding domain-containing protein [Magnetococcales bacterium]